MLPKTRRVIVFINGNGTVTAHEAYRAKIIAADLAMRGFKPLFHFRAPLRRLCKGWNPLYQYAIGRMVALYGI